MTTKNIEEQKKYEYWLYQTNPLRRNRMIRLTERGIDISNYVLADFLLDDSVVLSEDINEDIV